MASYTDKILPFNPYIQQLPVDAMVKVGMEKQRRYDEGVQKIQTQIDNIAGLDVVRDVDKQYLQSKLNDLGNNLKTVAAGDFSNYQLVNSTAGMVTQIGKDQNIQNAVYSTSNHKKQMKAMEEAKKKGEAAPENEVDYNKQFSKYMNSDKPGDLFNGNYTPYIDVNKKLFDIGKEVGLDETTVQQLFQTDEKGKILKDKDGKAIFNPVMVEQHLKGKDPAKLLEAFQNALTPADYNQLSITGRYVKGNLTPEQLGKEVIDNYSQNITNTSGKITSIDLELSKENAKNVKNTDLITSLNQEKKYFENQKLNLESSRDKDIQAITINPDAVRANLYTNNYLAKMSRDLSSSTKETINKINPEFEVSMKINEFNRQVQRDKITDYHWAIEQGQKKEDKLWEKEKFKLEMEAKFGKAEPGVNLAIDVPTNKFAIISTVQDDYSAKVDNLNNNNKLLTIAAFKKAKPRDFSKETEYEYNSRINKDMDDYIISQGKNNIKDKESFFADQAAKQINDWTKNGNNIPSEFRDLVKNQRDLMSSVETQKLDMQQIKQTALQKAKEQGLNYPSYEELKNKIKEIDISTHNGNFKLSKEDVLDFAKLHPEVHNIFSSFTVDDQQKRDRDQAKERLTLKYGNNFKELEDRLYGIASLTDGLLPMTDISLNVHREVKSAARLLSNINYTKVAEIEAQEYIDRGYLKQPKAYTVIRGKDNKEDVDSRIVDIIKANNKTGFSGVDPEDLIKVVLSGKDKAVRIIATPGISDRQPVNYTMEVTAADGKSIPIKITAQNFTYLTKQSPMISQNQPEMLTHLDSYGTTGRGGSEDPGSAWFSNDQFTNLKNVKYNVTANLVASIGNPNKLIFRMYIQEPGKPTEILDYDEELPRNNADGSFNQTLSNLPNGVTSNLIEQLRKTN